MAETAIDTFYRHLEPAESLATAFDDKNTVPLPDDWYIVITDIVGSTAAIGAGRYKDVNTAGGLAAMALSNAFGTLEFPFIFGGDGTTFLIPPEIREASAEILADTARKVKQFFALDLRVGIVPARDVYARKNSIRVGKIRVSPHYVQAVITGDGIDYAEKLVKSGTSYLVPQDLPGSHEANFTGFTCRWHDIPSEGGETVALIVRFTGGSEKANMQLLQTVLTAVDRHYGPDAQHHPIKEKTLRNTLSRKIIWREAAAKAGKKGGLLFLLQMMRITFESFVTLLSIKLHLPLRVFHYKLNRVKWYNVISSDYKKFDGMLKMVISGSPAARAGLVRELDRLKAENRLQYGIHVSDRALLTCLLHADSAQEVHFVDAADGGYALAAKMLKEQMR
ncbi:MAG: DUF3095 domain-containing protein [Spirochaetota bacterium]